MLFSSEGQLHRPQVYRLRRCRQALARLAQHVREVALPSVPQDREKYRESPFPSSLQVNDQLPGLLSSAAGALQRKKAQDNTCSPRAKALPQPLERQNVGIQPEPLYTGQTSPRPGGHSLRDPQQPHKTHSRPPPTKKAWHHRRRRAGQPQPTVGLGGSNPSLTPGHKRVLPSLSPAHRTIRDTPGPVTTTRGETRVPWACLQVGTGSQEETPTPGTSWSQRPEGTG